MVKLFEPARCIKNVWSSTGIGACAYSKVPPNLITINLQELPRMVLGLLVISDSNNHQREEERRFMQALTSALASGETLRANLTLTTQATANQAESDGNPEDHDQIVERSLDWMVVHLHEQALTNRPAFHNAMKIVRPGRTLGSAIASENVQEVVADPERKGVRLITQHCLLDLQFGPAILSLEANRKLAASLMLPDLISFLVFYNFDRVTQA